MSTLNPRLRNFSHKVVPMLQADALVVSVPKSGRTWLRFFLEHYYCARAGASVSFATRWNQLSSPIPDICFSHDLWHHVTTPVSYERILGVHLIPPQLRKKKKIILLLRDPRDVIVSLYLHLQKRGFKTGVSFDGSLSEMIRDSRLGIRTLLEIQNHWLEEWAHHEQCLIWRYEDCRRDPLASFSRVLRFLDGRLVDNGLVEESVAFADFGNMRTMERRGEINRPMLRPGNPADLESYKVRRGVVGGYADYLTSDDIAYIDRAVSGHSHRAALDAA